MPEYRALSTIVRVTSQITLTATLTVSDGVVTATLNTEGGAAAYGVIAAGSYRLPDFAQQVASKLETWVGEALQNDGNIDTVGTAVVTLTFTPSTSAGGSLFSLTITLSGTTMFGGGPGAITAGTIDNATGGYSPLGLVYETATGTTTRSASVAGGVATWSGLWQPRSLLVVERSEADFGDTEEAVQYKALAFADGTVSTYESGRHVTRRTLRLVDQSESIAGRPRVIGRTASGTPLATDKVTLNLATAATTELSGIANLYYDSEAATAGRYVRTPSGWVSRIRSHSSSSVVLCEKVPASTTELASSAIVQISELHAFWVEALRLGWVVVFEPSEASGGPVGAIRWVSEEYALAGGQAPRYTTDRLSAGAPLYSYTLELLKRDSSAALTLAS